MNTVTMETVLFPVTENCEDRENAITHYLSHGFASHFALWCKMVVDR